MSTYGSCRLLGLYESEWLANQSREKAKIGTIGSLKHQRNKRLIPTQLLPLRLHLWVMQLQFQIGLL